MGLKEQLDPQDLLEEEGEVVQLGLLDHKAKEGQGDLPDSSDSREKPAIREIQGLRELPGH